MHRPQVIFISNQEQSDQEPSKHKTEKARLPTHYSSRLVPQVSCRLTQSGINNEKSESRQNIKKQIDVRLSKAYSTIVRHKSIQLTGKKTKKLEISSSPHHPLNCPEDRESDFIINQASKELPYELLRDYIQNIYEEYSIPDPLTGVEVRKSHQESFFSQAAGIQGSLPIETPTKPSQIVREQNRVSTKKKILLLKNHFIDELNTERKTTLKIQSQKKNVTQNSQQSSIIQPVNPPQKTTNASAHKKKLSFALKEKSKVQQHTEKGSYNHLEDTKFTVSSANHLNMSLVNPTNDSYSHSRVENTRAISEYRPIENKKIDQLFRYCFVCEEAILEANISYHEKICLGLQEILTKQNMPKQEFLLMMDQKIEKIEKEVRQILTQVEEKQTTGKLVLLKQKVLEWIGIVNRESALNKSTEFKKTLEEEKNIDSIIESTKLMKTLELINKLKWFVHLKRNFLRKIQIHPHLL